MEHVAPPGGKSSDPERARQLDMTMSREDGEPLPANCDELVRGSGVVQRTDQRLHDARGSLEWRKSDQLSSGCDIGKCHRQRIAVSSA